MVYTVFSSGLEVEMTKEQASAMSHQGDCLEDVQAEIQNGLGEQLKGKEKEMRSELYEYGAWDDEELADDEKNLERILWLAAGNITDGDFDEE